MKNETLFPTPTDIRAYEIQARELRAETLKAGVVGIFNFIKTAPRRIAAFVARPAHA